MSNMPKEIAEAVTAVMQDVDYVQKKGTNEFHRYKFAAVGDVLAKLQPAMAKAGLCVVQHETSHGLIEDGSVMMASYQFILSHKAGVTWEIKPIHTGMASAKNSKGGFDDKALNKCHTAARKYFLLSLFQIPTGEHVDPDEEEDKPAPKKSTQPRPEPPQKPSVDNWIAGATAIVDTITTGAELSKWEKDNEKALDKLDREHPEKFVSLTNHIQNRRDALDAL